MANRCKIGKYLEDWGESQKLTTPGGAQQKGFRCSMDNIETTQPALSINLKTWIRDQVSLGRIRRSSFSGFVTHDLNQNSCTQERPMTTGTRPVQLGHSDSLAPGTRRNGQSLWKALFKTWCHRATLHKIHLWQKCHIKETPDRGSIMMTSSKKKNLFHKIYFYFLIPFQQTLNSIPDKNTRGKESTQRRGV